MTPTTIACDIHDHIEIICMRHYPVAIQLLDGSLVSGVAMDTRSKDKQEFILLEQDGHLKEIALQHIEQIKVLDDNAPQAQIWLHGAVCTVP